MIDDDGYGGPLPLDADEELLNIQNNPSEYDKSPAICASDLNEREFGDVHGKEADIIQEIQAMENRIENCDRVIELLQTRVQRYRYRKEFLEDELPNYARDHAEERLEELCRGEPIDSPD